MVASMLITFRETLEAALIVGVVASLLKREKESYSIIIWATLAGILASIIAAFGFVTIAGGFTGKVEYIFEGVVMILGAILLSTLILWLHKQQNHMFKSKLTEHISNGKKVNLFLLIFLSIFREGIETTIFLWAAYTLAEFSFIGALLGVFIALICAYAFYKGMIAISLQHFFLVTNILLVLFAAGLLAHGVHEFQEAEVVPIFIEHVYDLNPAVVIEGKYPALHEKGAIGGIFKGLFGYNGNPNLLEIITYILFLIVFSSITFLNKKSSTTA